MASRAVGRAATFRRKYSKNQKFIAGGTTPGSLVARAREFSKSRCSSAGSNVWDGDFRYPSKLELKSARTVFSRISLVAAALNRSWRITRLENWKMKRFAKASN